MYRGYDNKIEYLKQIDVESMDIDELRKAYLLLLDNYNLKYKQLKSLLQLAKATYSHTKFIISFDEKLEDELISINEAYKELTDEDNLILDLSYYDD